METASLTHAPEKKKATPPPEMAAPMPLSAEADLGAPAGMPLFLQRSSLLVNEQGDIYEQQADRAADRVTSQAETHFPVDSINMTGIQRKGSGGSGGMTAPANIIPSGGHALPASTRTHFEGRFGQDFSGVRVHTGDQAAHSARSVNARAFAAGQDVVFGAGEYQPDTAAGQHLLAHELAHVVQQGGYQRRIQREDGAGMTSASEPMSVAAPEENMSRMGPPVVFGMDTATRRIYASVAIPGSTILNIAAYVYGSTEKAAELQSTNGLPDFVPPGRNLRLVDGQLSEAAQQAINQALENGTIMRTEGVPTGETGEGEVMTYRFSAAGQEFVLTEGQLRGMLTGLGVWIYRKANYYYDMAQNGSEVHQEFLDDTNSAVRGISDWLADQDTLSTFIWILPKAKAQVIKDTLRDASFNSGDINRGLRLIPQHAQQLAEAAEALDDAQQQWHRYIEGTISGAQVAVNRLEVVRNVSFGIAAGLVGAVAAPVIFAAAGTALAGVGVTGTAATILSGTAAVGGGALAGGTLQGTLNVAAPGAQADQSVGDRFSSGFQQGALSGGLGAAGALAAPGVSGAISQRLYGTAPQALTTFGERAAVGTLTGLSIGAPTGAAGAAIANVGALARGEITPAQYLERIGWGTLQGATFGAAFGFLGAALSRGPSTAITRQTPPRGPAWETSPVRVDPQTGMVSQMAVVNTPNGPVYLQATYNPATGMGQVVNLSTGQQVAVITNGQFTPPAAGLLGTPGAATTPTAGGGIVPAPGGTGLIPAPVNVPPRLGTAGQPGLLPLPQGTGISSAAPASLPVTRVTLGTPDASYQPAPDIVPVGVILEFPDGTRVWRQTADGPVFHESTLGTGPGRADYELDFFARGQHGNLPAGANWERAHSLGQGTGFESPYGIRYAPSYVNQTLQNNGVELLMRQLADLQDANTAFRVVTQTTTHSGTLRLAQISYRVEVVSGGQTNPFFDYAIQVQSTPPYRITAAPINFANNPAAVAQRARVTVPNILFQNISVVAP